VAFVFGKSLQARIPPPNRRQARAPATRNERQGRAVLFTAYRLNCFIHARKGRRHILRIVREMLAFHALQEARHG